MTKMKLLVYLEGIPRFHEDKGMGNNKEQGRKDGGRKTAGFKHNDNGSQKVNQEQVRGLYPVYQKGIAEQCA
ncbi:MAG TPA: hypothetical protein PLS28_03005, partial [Clostridiales bacterium]|nr:hypothetical protein [Clostridiales bacterium]